ncbi:MAG TPA: leucyl aminopeptidase family protein [Chlamydiales bacterium]|nr:leucyl aminopeptidase family protein [Chlamydiales bacterium]
MKIGFSQDFEGRKKSDLLIAPYWEGLIAASQLEIHRSSMIASLFKMGDFQGKWGETALLYSEGEKESRLLLLGLGKKEEATSELLRRAFSLAMKTAQSKKAKHIQMLFPSEKKWVREIIDGLVLTNYRFVKLKHDSLKEMAELCESLTIFGLDKTYKNQIDNQLFIASSGVSFVRDLVNENADDVTPDRFVKEAKALGKEGVKVRVLDRKKLEKEKMGLLLAVGQGARYEPYLIQAEHWGAPKSKEHILLVGKGITYDTGGLCLKPPDGMLGMKADMAGAATVLAAVKIAAGLRLKVNVTALAPVAENAIDSRSYKQGDVYQAVNGKTVEIVNTDAEGRLILADAIAYGVKHLRPTHIIDIGTLTGAILIALGDEVAGFFTNSESIAKDLESASQKTGENIWRLPLYDYKESLRSDIADMTNLGGRDAGSMKCALFLQEFTQGIPWAHIDMAGPAYISKPKYYNPTKGTGWGLRLLLDFLQLRD